VLILSGAEVLRVPENPVQTFYLTKNQRRTAGFRSVFLFVTGWFRAIVRKMATAPGAPDGSPVHLLATLRWWNLVPTAGLFGHLVRP